MSGPLVYPMMPRLRRRGWSTYLKIIGIISAFGLILLSFYNGNSVHHLNWRFGGPDKLHQDIWNSTLGFEKIFVLNLPSRTDRRDALSLAAAFSNITLDWMDGVSGQDVSEKALPPGERVGLSIGARGSWRAHMNAIRRIVDQNLGSALIMEDDIDWDIRLQSQLQTFALASQALLSDFVGIMNPLDNKKLPDLDTLSDPQKVSFPLTSLPFPHRPKFSSYGDDWDILWLGHCGTTFRSQDPSPRILILNDITVPSPSYVKPHPFANPDGWATLYPPHTRIVHAPAGPSCPLAYAISQRGARKVLYEFGVKAFDKQLDFMFADFCENVEEIDGTRSGVGRAESGGVCVTVQPPLFSHHFPEGATSDIDGTGGGMITMIGTLYIRWSVRMNLGRLVRGMRGMIDQWPDK